MNRSHLIIVHGISATGKTRLATKIAEHFNLPLVSRDSLKEIIFDDLGWSDREWSTKVGKAAYDLLDYFVEQQLKAGNSLIVETPYNPKFENEKFQQWQADYHFNAIQILCYAEGSVVVDRFKKRSNSGERHPGHNDIDSFEELQEKLLKGKAEYLDLKGSVIEVDTTDFNNIDESSIFEQIDSGLKQQALIPAPCLSNCCRHP